MYLGIVTHLVWEFCVEIAFSISSSALDFFSFFTRLFTAFSDHFPSIDESSLPFFHANKRFTIGGVNGSIFLLSCYVCFSNAMYDVYGPRFDALNIRFKCCFVYFENKFFFFVSFFINFVIDWQQL